MAQAIVVDLNIGRCPICKAWVLTISDPRWFTCSACGKKLELIDKHEIRSNGI